MGHSPTHVILILFKLFILLLCMSIHLPGMTFGSETDGLVLLDLKKRVTEDPFGIMSSWNHSLHFCSWEGVTCHNSTKRIVVLNLEAQSLAASMPPSIGNLTHLIAIKLGNNRFHGEIPQEMGRLRTLLYLNLSQNSFTGKLPTNISHCKQMKVLNVSYNQLIGSIPNQLSSLENLNLLLLQSNNLTGTIPAWIGNFSSLRIVYLDSNNLQGSIPKELGGLTVLNELSLGENNMSGMVPSSIYNISSMSFFGIAHNQLHGEMLPNNGVNLPKLQIISGGGNRFTGNIPASLSNASRLQHLDFVDNDLTGRLPAESFGRLLSLVCLSLEGNRLGSGETGDLNFLSFLTNSTGLQKLGLSGNHLGGELPESIANLSTQLNYLGLGGNLIHGNLPKGIGNLVKLTILDVYNNYLVGHVPVEIGKLQNLEILVLEGNKFSGPIPSSIGDLASLTKLYLAGNRFEGGIPPSLGQCQRLLELSLSNNNLTGAIPKEVTGLSSLTISLDLSNNYLTGALPFEVGDLDHLTKLDVSRNKLSGEIPSTLDRCIMLVSLHLEGNQFEGEISQSFEHLRSLEEIDISYNNLSGHIPEYLSKFFFLKHLNLSYNDFEGDFPKEGIFSNVSGVSLLGNHRLCGGIPKLRLPACPSRKHHSSRGILSPKVFIPLACGLALVIALSSFISACSVRKKSKSRPINTNCSEDWKLSVSYSELVESTNGFSMDNLIGSGSFGSVYKGILPSVGTVVAVKVLNLLQEGGYKSFIDECKALRSVRHRNLLKIITACSSIDNRGNDFKGLVFEYMENGSLDSWLHRRNDDEKSKNEKLSLIQRLNIAIDVASALDYLHHQCETSVVHCDLKPSNVLLDEEMVAHVGDFGLARLLFEPSNDPSESQTISAGLKGSIGYIPPEYGLGGQVSVLGDIYSYGILVLEIFTGKKPTDEIFKDGLSIHQMTATACRDHVIDVVDPLLLLETNDAYADDDDRYNKEIQERPAAKDQERGSDHVKKLEECLDSVMQIALSCSATLPTERMTMDVVVNKMKAIRDSYLQFKTKKLAIPQIVED